MGGGLKMARWIVGMEEWCRLHRQYLRNWCCLNLKTSELESRPINSPPSQGSQVVAEHSPG